MARVAEDYDKNVFINCLFDSDYQPIFNALVFATFECGLRPRCALEINDSGEARIEKIARVIRQCHWGIHDISRTELNPSGLPRFNMPLELGIFLGARWFGDRSQRRKSCLVLDTDRYRYQEYISDIAGQDIEAHQGNSRRAIRAVRNWLGASRANIRHTPGAAAIHGRFERFMVDLPAICVETDREVGDLTFTEFADAASTWLKTEVARTGVR
jgi:hypothetical protein